MTRAATTHNWVNSNIASWKGSFQPISEMLNAVLVRTNDTGQVNWATISTVPPAGSAGSVRDYEVFRLTDALQATAPIFIRVDYAYSGTSAILTLRFTVGSSTDGAGNIGGVTATGIQTYSMTVAPTPPAGGFNAYASSDGSSLVLAHNLNANSATHDVWGGVVVERFRNLDGTPSPEGYNVWNFDSTTASLQGAGHLARQYSRIFAATNQPPMETWPNPLVMVPGVNANNTFFLGDTSYAFPFYTSGPLLRGASKCLLIGFKGDFPRLSEVTLTHYGAPMKFLSFGPAGDLVLPYLTAWNVAAAKGGFGHLLRWE